MPKEVSGRVVKTRIARPGPAGHGEVELGALALADPVALHREDALRPADEAVTPLEELLRVGRDLEVPALDLLRDHLGVAAPAAPGLDLLVGEHGLTARAPVDARALLVREPALEHLDEDELLPAVVLGIARRDLAVPVVGDPERLHLGLHGRDVLVRPHRRVHAVVDGGVLGGEAEGVPPHRVEHVVPAHPLVAGDRVADGVVPDVPHVDPAGRVREHLEAVVLRAAGLLAHPEETGLVPDALPLRLDVPEGIVVGPVLGHGSLEPPPINVHAYLAEIPLRCKARPAAGAGAAAGAPRLRPLPGGRSRGCAARASG